jgi:hypothetical protein
VSLQWIEIEAISMQIGKRKNMPRTLYELSTLTGMRE